MDPGGQTEAPLSPLQVFFAGITMSHYTWHSLSPSAKVVTVSLRRILSFITELFLFIYAGELGKQTLSCFILGTSDTRTSCNCCLPGCRVWHVEHAAVARRHLQQG